MHSNAVESDPPSSLTGLLLYNAGSRRGPGFPRSLSSLHGTEVGCFVSFNHNVNSELEDAKKKPFRGKWKRLGRAGHGGRAGEGSVDEDEKFKDETEDGRWREELGREP